MAGRTLFQMWTDKMRRGNSPTEFQYPNPAKAKIGAQLTLDVPDLRNIFFSVQDIRVSTRTIRGQEFTSTDYDIVGGGKHLRLRYFPQAEKTATGNEYRVILLSIDEDHEYSADEHNALKEDTGTFEIFGDDEKLESRWFRIDDVRGAFHPLVANIKDANGDGSVKDSEVTQEKLEYWDFNRQIKSIGLNDVVEYLFIEIAGDTGWMKSWRGPEIDADQVQWV